jgi:hypothetical protein
MLLPTENWNPPLAAGGLLPAAFRTSEINAIEITIALAITTVLNLMVSIPATFLRYKYRGPRPS